MENTISQNTNGTEPLIPTQKILLWIALAGIIMFFAALMSGYIVRQAEGNWLVFEIPSMFYVSTVVILLSSLTMELSKSAIRKDENKKAYQYLAYTLALGLVFVVCQFRGWNQLVGLSDHTTSITVPIAATALGVSVIEKHFTLDRMAEGPDS